MPESMERRVAKAICKSRTCEGVNCCQWPANMARLAPGRCPVEMGGYDDAARAAIEAMRKPSNRMLKAACAAMSPGKRPTKARVSNKAKQGIRYRAMIDAALEEK